MTDEDLLQAEADVRERHRANDDATSMAADWHRLISIQETLTRTEENIDRLGG